MDVNPRNERRLYSTTMLETQNANYRDSIAIFIQRPSPSPRLVKGVSIYNLDDYGHQKVSYQFDPTGMAEFLPITHIILQRL
jgi:hypothetical protein